MKTNRKKMLLSSIAMLLVALVALGSATYAWFTVNKEVTASGFTGKASSAYGLKILSQSEANTKATNESTTYSAIISDISKYGQSTNFYSTAIQLSPVSMKPATTISAFATNGTSESNGAWNGTDDVVPASAGSYNAGPYYVEDVYVALSGTDDATATGTFKIKNWSVDFANTALAKGARVFVYYDANGTKTLVGQYASEAKSTDEVIDSVDVDNGEKLSDSGKTESVSYTTMGVPAAAANSFTVGNAGNYKFTFVVFLDGQDTNTKTANIVNSGNLVSGFNVKFELD